MPESQPPPPPYNYSPGVAVPGMNLQPAVPGAVPDASGAATGGATGGSPQTAGGSLVATGDLHDGKRSFV